MSVASQQFNSTIFGKSNELTAAEDYCDTVFEYRHKMMKTIRDFVKDLSTIDKQYHDEPVFINAKKLVMEAIDEGQLIINIEKGTVHCKPYKKIIEEYMNKHTSPTV